MDLAVMPTTTDGFHYLLVYQDYSKFIELLPLKDKSPKTVAKLLVTEIFMRSGLCDDLHSDQGQEFDGKLIRELCTMWGIHKTRTCSFTPWSNGMVERSNQTIKGILRQMSTEERTGTWVDRLPFVRLALNCTVHSSTGMTPFKLWMARTEDLVLPSDLIFDIPRSQAPLCPGEYLEEQKAEMQRVFELARIWTGKAVKRQKVANQEKGLKHRDYKVDEWV